MIDTQRKFLNRQQTELRRVLMRSDWPGQALQLFLDQHAMLHSAGMDSGAAWSFEDAILDDMTSEQIRRVPKNCDHSVAWCLWHMARIEDIAMNVLVAGRPQVSDRAGWQARLQSPVSHAGNAMSTEEAVHLSATIDLEALRDYRVAVGHRTREIVQQLDPDDLKQKVDPTRLQRVRDEGAVVEEAWAIVDYWSRRTIAGLLLMPATRHNLVHLNEALRLKRRRR